MTADAKVGLLLGLVFIVMIAFLINGLPNFLKAASPGDMVTTAITIPATQELVIDPRLVETAQQLQTDGVFAEPASEEETVVTQEQPVALPAAESPAAAESAPQVAIAPASAPIVVAEIPAESKAVKKEQQPSGRVHVVKQGESLAAIAQKYYGKEEGNRRAVIQKLYEANKSVLESPDKVCAGDKLTIPSQNERPQTALKPVAASPQRTLMEKFSGMFEKTEKTGKTKDKKESVKTKTRVYVVQRGDNLWSIAQKTLGDGKRYPEIVKLNQGIKADDLVVGMSLKIPPK